MSFFMKAVSNSESEHKIIDFLLRKKENYTQLKVLIGVCVVRTLE